MAMITMKDRALDEAHSFLRRIRDNPDGQPWASLDAVIARVQIARKAGAGEPVED